MNLRGIAALLLVAPTLTACTTTFDILPSEVPHLRTGTVHSPGGSEKTVGAEYSVRLIPHDGAVLLSDPASPDIVAFPEYDERLGVARDFKPVSEFYGPIRSTFGGRYITAVDGSFRVWAGSVKEISITQLSPGKTAGIVIGSLAGGATFIGLFILAVQAIGSGLSGIGAGK